MRSRLPLLLLHLAVLVCVAVSSALLVDYLRPVAAFCGLGSGCDKVRTSGLGRLLGMPVPLLGLLAFGVLLAVSVMDSPTARRLTRLLAVSGGIAGVILIAVMTFEVRAFCKLCLMVDGAAIVAALAALFVRPDPGGPLADERSPPATPWLWPSAGALAVLLPIGWSFLQPAPDVPVEIARLWVPGKINVVEFADFECPFCRKLHPEMTEVLSEHEGQVHFVRLNMPLAGHPHARDAARAYCCAEEQGKASAMADALFTAEGLTKEDCERIAASLQMSLTEYRACVASASTERKIDEQVRQVRSAGLQGLPTVWIEDRMIVGLQPIEALREAFAEAAKGRHPTRVTAWWLWGGLSIGLAAIAVYATRIRAS